MQPVSNKLPKWFGKEHIKSPFPDCGESKHPIYSQISPKANQKRQQYCTPTILSKLCKHTCIFVTLQTSFIICWSSTCFWLCFMLRTFSISLSDSEHLQHQPNEWQTAKYTLQNRPTRWHRSSRGKGFLTGRIFRENWKFSAHRWELCSSKKFNHDNSVPSSVCKLNLDQYQCVFTARLINCCIMFTIDIDIRYDLAVTQTRTISQDWDRATRTKHAIKTTRLRLVSLGGVVG